MPKSTTPNQSADRFILRFEHPGQREHLKEQAKNAKRSLNKHIMYLLERAQANESEKCTTQ